MKPKPVMIFAGMVVKTYQDVIYLSSCTASKIFVNLDIEETSAIRSMILTAGNSEQVLQQSQETMQVQTMNDEPIEATIKELLNFNPSDIKQTLLKTTITIAEVDTSAGWFYYACNECQKSLDENEEGFSCFRHGPKTPRLTMRLPLLIKDDNGEMDITAFDRHAANMTGINISTMSVIEEISKKNIPAKIKDLEGRKYQLTLALPKRSMEHGALNYRINGTKRLNMDS